MTIELKSVIQNYNNISTVYKTIGTGSTVSYVAQAFKPDENIWVSDFSIFITKTGSPTTLSARILGSTTDDISTAAPDWTKEHYSQYNKSISSLTGQITFDTFSSDPYPLRSGKIYWIVITGAGTPSYTISFIGSNTSSYSDGCSAYYTGTAPSGTWSYDSRAYDLEFIVNGLSDEFCRKNQKIFAGSVPNTGVVSVFGSLKNSNPEYSSDPDDIQSLPAWIQGWQSAVINNYWPCIQDFNALFYTLSRQIEYLFQSGIPEYSSLIEYSTGSIVSDGVLTLYKSTTDSNTGNALSDTDHWVLYSTNSPTVLDSGTTYNVLASDGIIIVSTSNTESAIAVHLPTVKSVMSGRTVVIKNSSLSATITLDVTGGGTINGSASVTIARHITVKVLCDGTNWTIIHNA